MANNIILKSGETVPTVDNLEELEPGIDKTTNKLYTKINGQIVSLNDTSWENIQNKPETFPPEEHTHEIIDIENLESEITLIKESIDGKMDSPTNTGSSGQYLIRSSSNQGTWTTIPNVSSSQNGLMTTTLYNKLNGIVRYITNEGVSSGWTFRLWSDDFVELWRSIRVSNIDINIALGNWYRSNSPFGQSAYSYPYTFTSYPNVQVSFFSTNSLSALVWLNPVASQAYDYPPPLYLIRPTSSTDVSGYINFYISGNT